MEVREGVETREWVVDAAGAGQRLDVFLAQHLPGSSRSQLQRLIRQGWVERAGASPQKSGELVEAGDVVRVALVPAELNAVAEDLPLGIVYEDDELLVVNKPAGMVVHVGAGARTGTLVNALLHHVQQLSSVAGPDRPGIVHRLDKMTSGLLVVAKNDRAHRALSASFKARTVRKVYAALVHGTVVHDEGAVDAPVGRDPGRRFRMKINGIRARDSFTAYQVRRRFERFTYLYAMPRSGRTHQIRVHLASIGHPVVGDMPYGAPAKIRLAGRDEPTLARTFLHAFTLEFDHPSSGARMSFEAPLPPDLAGFLDRLIDVHKRL